MKIGKYLILILFLTGISLNTGCGRKGGNPVADYMRNSQLTYSNKQQRDVVMLAARDVTMLSSDDLKKERYTDDSGNEHRWDLQTLFTNRFVPKKSNLSWGNDFYKDVKADSVLMVMSYILTSY
ncbi:MAG: hypothetical protein ACHQJ4_04790 [Ignavibacteria bacterium]